MFLPTEKIRLRKLRACHQFSSPARLCILKSKMQAFREWFAQFDAEIWDRQFESDVKSGKLNELAERALNDSKSGRSKEL